MPFALTAPSSLILPEAYELVQASPLSPPQKSFFQQVTDSSLKTLEQGYGYVQQAGGWIKREVPPLLQSTGHVVKEGLEYGRGVIDGMNPLTPVADAITETFGMEHNAQNDPSPLYWEGRSHGSAAGMGIDGGMMGGGGALAMGSLGCAATTIGMCVPVAGPGLAVGATAAGVGTAILPLHGSNYEKTQRELNRLEMRGKGEIGATREIERSRDTPYIKEPQVKELPGFPGTNPTKRKTQVQGGGKLRARWKDQKGNIYEWDYKKGTLEKYNKTGKKHLGEFDHLTGRQVGNAKTGRTVEK